jgi:cytochrome c peroxidase
MATTFSRALHHVASRVPLTARSSTRLIAPRVFRQQSRRGYASGTSSSGGNSGLFWLLGVAAVGGGGYYTYSQGMLDGVVGAKAKPFEPKFEDYQKVYDAIAAKLADETDYDDGSYGPVLLRLAWHTCGTYVLHNSNLVTE